MKKIILDARDKIESFGLQFLSGDEFRAYFEYRIKNLLSKKVILVGDELEYLLCETGPGNLRTDPEFLPLITKEKTFTEKTFTDKTSPYQELNSLLLKKSLLKNIS
ncbi:MAG: hypothetical protein L6420_04040 [Elusimicrobia bacterium]|nr:hypothetical protein [Nanoarchaeota archaeon]MCG2725422.1 hypothetical protein [Elusimicrobiota bacterium]